MNRRQCLNILSGSSLAAAAATQPRRRPNVVFILTDDHRWDMLGCAGHPWLKTPNLDRLAAGGARVSSRELRSTAADLHRRMVGILKETQGLAWLSGPPV